MIFNPYLEWLGFRTRRPVAGIHITSTHLIVVALRRRPLRLVAVGRRAIPGAAVVDGDIRLVEPLVATLRALVTETRITPGTPAVAVLDPLAETVAIDLSTPAGAVCDVSARTHDHLVRVVAGAGLTLRTVDVVPTALARLGGLVAAPAVALDAAHGWTTIMGNGRLDGRRTRSGQPHSNRPTLRLGTDAVATVPVAELPGIEVPGPLRSAFQPGRDAVAVGGALAPFGHGPAVTVRPAVVPVGSGWTVQSVGRLESSWPNREPIAVVPAH